MEGLRGWAVLLVFFVHSHTALSGFLSPTSLLFGVSRFLGTIGNVGVDLFFVISGYLIYGAVLRPRFRYARFLLRRVQRIYPAFLAVISIYLFLGFFSSNEHFKFYGSLPQKASFILQNLLLMPGIFPVRPMLAVSWSLSYEIFFYLLLPLVVAVTAMRQWVRWTRISLFAFLLTAGLLLSPTLDNPRVRLVGFLFGILLFEVADRFRGRSTALVDLSILGAYLVALVFIYFIDSFRLVPEHSLRTVITAIIGVGSFALCGFCFHGGGLLGSLLSWRPLRYLGNMSYSFYLVHAVALGLLRQAAWRAGISGQGWFLFVVLLLAALAFSWIVATLLFLLVERPFSIDVGRTRAAAPEPVHAAVAMDSGGGMPTSSVSCTIANPGAEPQKHWK